MQQVAAFRRGLDIGKANDASGKSGLFDLALANELYGTLLGQVEPLVKDKRSLLVVPSGALTALPFHLLVTEKPAAAIPDNFDGYREAAWLLKRQAVAVLPSVVSLKTLRVSARREQSTKPMTGFGDPLFNPSQEGSGDKRGAIKSAARGVTNVAYTDFWKGAGVDRARLAQALPQLPDTADELNAVAKDLGDALVRTLVFFPGTDIVSNLNQFPRPLFLKFGTNPRNLSTGGNHHGKHAFARAPAHPGVIKHGRTRLNVECINTVLTHQAPGVFNSGPAFVE